MAGNDVATPDLYELLGVERGATEDELKRAYRRQARRYHPDYNPDDPDSERRFKEVHYAWQVLSDPGRRVQYDRFGRVFTDGRSQGPFGAAQEVDLAAVVGTIVKDFFGRGGKKEPAPRDLRYTVRVTLEEVATGVEREVAFERVEGGTTRGEHLKVRVPPGVDTGQKLKVPGRGLGGAAAKGDLLVVVHVEPHAWFQRQGADLFCDLPVTYAQLVLGADLEVPTLDGLVTIRVPPGSKPGTVLSLRGRGLPGLRGGRGELFVRVQLDIPTEITEAQRRRLQAWDQDPEAVRSHEWVRWAALVAERRAPRAEARP